MALEYTSDAVSQYRIAQKAGEKYYNDAVSAGENPYLPVLDDLVPDITSLKTQYLGLLDIPSELIVGTKTAGRQEAFAGNFMPLLEKESEFGMKWVSLCGSHFDIGIREPIVCFEYMGKFYVQEGNKRVSVLKSLGARKIQGTVTRIYPAPEDTGEYRAYCEFLHFYELSGLYTVQYRNAKNYAKLQASLGFSPEHVWTEEEKMAFSSRLFTFSSVFEERKKADYVDINAAGALLCWLQVYPYESLREMTMRELDHSVGTVWQMVRLAAADNYEIISTRPESVERTFLSRLFSSQISSLSIAFIHAKTTSGSNWVSGHEAGARHLEEVFGGRVNVENDYADVENAEGIMEQAIRNGAQVLIVTAPTLLSATRKAAAMHPKVIMLICALSLPMAGVSSYYSRIYEAKFISGALAGAMTNDDMIGFIARYPIFGVPAEINAFALGARMTNPDVKIRLKWTCTEGNPLKELISEGVRVVSGNDVSSEDELFSGHGIGTFQIDEGGTLLPISTPCWNWGTFYEKVIRYILNGEWGDLSREDGSEVNYWWGLDSGVIDVALPNRLPAGVTQLAKIIKKGILRGEIDIFKTTLIDRDGILRNDGSIVYEPQDIVCMDWLLDNVDGTIPSFDALLPMARSLTRVLGVYRDEIPPEKEGFVL